MGQNKVKMAKEWMEKGRKNGKWPKVKKRGKKKG